MKITSNGGNVKYSVCPFGPAYIVFISTAYTDVLGAHFHLAPAGSKRQGKSFELSTVNLP